MYVTGKKSSKSRSGRKSRPSSGRKHYDDSSDEEVDTLDQYHMVSIQVNTNLNIVRILIN